MAVITNSTGGQFRLTMLGENTTSKEVDIYQISITSSDPISFSADGLSAGNYEYATQWYKNGNIAGQTRGNEIEPSGEFSFTFKEDFDYLGKKHIYGNSKNLILNFLNGEAFVNKTHTIVPIGTNGTTKTVHDLARANEMNKPYKYIYYNEGAFIKKYGTADPANAYKASLKRNPFETTFNQSHKTFSGEILTTSGRGQVNRMFAILAKGSVEFAEDMDSNKYTVTANRGCDLFERDDFFTEVHSMTFEEADEYMKVHNELYVDFIKIHDGDEPDAGSNNGKLLLEIGSSGEPTLKKSNSSSWQTSGCETLQGYIKVGTRFKTKHVENSSSDQIKANAFAVIGADGENCVNFKTSGGNRFFCKVKNFDIEGSLDYEDYLTLE